MWFSGNKPEAGSVMMFLVLFRIHASLDFDIEAAEDLWQLGTGEGNALKEEFAMVLFSMNLDLLITYELM